MTCGSLSNNDVVDEDEAGTEQGNAACASIMTNRRL
jgi:hypothetical protein